MDVKPLYFELWVALSEHDKACIQRGLRRKVLLAGREIFVNLISPEDLIVTELLRCSLKDRIDMLSILESTEGFKIYQKVGYPQQECPQEMGENLKRIQTRS